MELHRKIRIVCVACPFLGTFKNPVIHPMYRSDIFWLKLKMINSVKEIRTERNRSQWEFGSSDRFGEYCSGKEAKSNN